MVRSSLKSIDDEIIYSPEGAKIYENTKPRYFTNRTEESKEIKDENGKIEKYAYDVAYKKRDDNMKKR